MSNLADAPSRPRFTEREGRLLVAALYRWRKEEPLDDELRRLYLHLLRVWGSEEERNAVR